MTTLDWIAAAIATSSLVYIGIGWTAGRMIWRGGVGIPGADEIPDPLSLRGTLEWVGELALPCPVGRTITEDVFTDERRQIMKDLSNREMIEKARTVLRPRKLSFENTAGTVACALLSARGNLYFGVCIDVSCSMGFCAEHSAIAAMVTAGESRIAKIVAIHDEGEVIPPCGRCREFMYQINRTNLANTDVILGENDAVKLRALLPHPWGEEWDAQAFG